MSGEQPVLTDKTRLAVHRVLARAYALRVVDNWPCPDDIRTFLDYSYLAGGTRRLGAFDANAIMENMEGYVTRLVQADREAREVEIYGTDEPSFGTYEVRFFDAMSWGATAARLAVRLTRLQLAEEKSCDAASTLERTSALLLEVREAVVKSSVADEDISEYHATECPAVFDAVAVETEAAMDAMERAACDVALVMQEEGIAGLRAARAQEFPWVTREIYINMDLPDREIARDWYRRETQAGGAPKPVLLSKLGHV